MQKRANHQLAATARLAFSIFAAGTVKSPPAALRPPDLDRLQAEAEFIAWPTVVRTAEIRSADRAYRIGIVRAEGKIDEEFDAHWLAGIVAILLGRESAD